MFRILAIALVAAFSSPSHAVSTDFVYEGICEASAAVAIDATHFVVADDESNVLWTYEIGNPRGKPSPSLDAYLDTERRADGSRKKADLEAGARIGDRIYWMGSHSRDSDARREPSRLRFFATPLRADEVPREKPYRRLLDDMADDPRLDLISKAASARLGAEDDGGLNIEGLAATPDGKLLIGFRNPRDGSRAIVVPFDNPADVIAGRAKAKFRQPILLELGNRGIRSIDWVGDRYLIVAGPSGSGAPGFALFGWSGNWSDAPQRWVDADLEGLGPEALIRLPGTSSVLLLSDDGGTRCKPVAKSFRTRTLDLSTATFR